MYEQRIEIEEEQRLTLVEMASSLSVRGWDENHILLRLRDGEDGLTVEDGESGPVVSAQTPCEVWMPSATTLALRQARANLTVRDLADFNAEQVRGNMKLCDLGSAVVAEIYGNAKASRVDTLRLVGTVYGDADLREVPSADLQNVRGNLRARDIGRLRASRIGGNLLAKSIAGPLDSDQVGGNSLLKEVTGLVSLDQVAGNLTAKSLTGGAKVPKVGGNLVLTTALGRGCTYHFRVSGNAVLRFAPETSAHLTLSAKGNLKSSADLGDVQHAGRTLTGVLGDGGAELVVDAKGNVLLGGSAAAGSELGEEISRQIEESMSTIDFEAIGRQVSVEMEAALSRLRAKMETVDWERIGLQTQTAVERAMDRMQTEADHLAEKATRQQERLERKVQREARRQQRREYKHARHSEGGPENEIAYDLETTPPELDPSPATPIPDLEHERLSILRMVEQGQVTPAEAEMLLDALG